VVDTWSHLKAVCKIAIRSLGTFLAAFDFADEGRQLSGEFVAEILRSTLYQQRIHYCGYGCPKHVQELRLGDHYQSNCQQLGTAADSQYDLNPVG